MAGTSQILYDTHIHISIILEQMGSIRVRFRTWSPFQGVCFSFHLFMVQWWNILEDIPFGFAIFQYFIKMKPFSVFSYLMPLFGQSRFSLANYTIVTYMCKRPLSYHNLALVTVRANRERFQTGCPFFRAGYSVSFQGV